MGVVKEMSIEFVNYDSNFKEDPVKFNFPDRVESVEFTYDGGRVTVYINDKEVFYTPLGGNDFCVSLKNDK